MSFDIKVEGAEELILKLETLKQLNHVRKVIAQQGVLLQRFVRVYPKQIGPITMPGSKKPNRGKRYKRTNRLKGSWTSYSSLDSMSATVENNMPYAMWVQGWETQTLRHKWGGWVTEKGVVDTHRKEVEANIRAALEKEVANANTSAGGRLDR